MNMSSMFQVPGEMNCKYDYSLTLEPGNWNMELLDVDGFRTKVKRRGNGADPSAADQGPDVRRTWNGGEAYLKRRGYNARTERKRF